MKRILQLLIFSFLLTACSDSKIEQYNAIVNKASRAEINYINLNETVELESDQLDLLKSVITDEIEPRRQSDIVADIEINLYENESNIGKLMITDDTREPFANFNSENLEFGFVLTYGIGMYLDDNKAQLTEEPNEEK